MKEIGDEQIVQEAKAAEKRTGFCDLIHQQKDVNSAYGIGFIEGMVRYRELLKHQKREHLNDIWLKVLLSAGFAVLCEWLGLIALIVYNGITGNKPAHGDDILLGIFFVAWAVIFLWFRKRDIF